MAVQRKEFVWTNDKEGKGIIGSMNDQGVVTFAIDAGPDSSIRGTVFFNAMMDFFGSDVAAIHGSWSKGAPDRVSTNIDKVNELTRAGVVLDEAVKHTWTTTRAMKRGFAKVRVIGIPERTAGAYSRIEVLIER